MTHTDPTTQTSSAHSIGGTFADALTLIRALLTPFIMAVIIIGWRGESVAGDYTVFEKMVSASIFASILFGLAALTDVIDDMIGGAENSRMRRHGWFDDIADTILVTGTLAALLYATYRSGALGLGLAIPAIIIIARELLIGLVKGYELTRTGWPETAFGTAKNALAMISTLILVASPWLTNWIDNMRFDGTNAEAVFAEPSAYIWNLGLIGLWATAILSVVTGVMLLSAKSSKPSA
jgi:phosphatidylglycerophosphate synthase